MPKVKLESWSDLHEILCPPWKLFKGTLSCQGSEGAIGRSQRQDLGPASFPSWAQTWGIYLPFSRLTGIKGKPPSAAFSVQTF